MTFCFEHLILVAKDGVVGSNKIGTVEIYLDEGGGTRCIVFQH